MFKNFRMLKIFWISLIAAVMMVIVKYIFHYYNWEPIEQSSLHNSIVSSATFVIGFLLSATIADYKESERMPSEFAASLENIYDDSASIHETYPSFDLPRLKKQLHKIAMGFTADARKKSYDARKDIRELAPFFAAMEAGGVPPNFVVKLKQQQANLLRARHRLNYIQKIKFIPSATILVRSIVFITLAMLLLTNVDPFYGSLAIIGIIAFIFVYMLVLINVISTPFHAAGKTRDDVSMFLIDEAAEYLSKK